MLVLGIELHQSFGRTDIFMLLSLFTLVFLMSFNKEWSFNLSLIQLLFIFF